MNNEQQELLDESYENFIDKTKGLNLNLEINRVFSAFITLCLSPATVALLSKTSPFGNEPVFTNSSVL